MIKTTLLMAPLALLLGVAAACGPDEPAGDAGDGESTAAVGQRVETEGGFYVDISPQELQSMLGNEDFPLVNVHIPFGREIEGTDLLIPFDQISERLNELPEARDSKIVLYCRSGGMSAVAARTLVSSGYTDVWNLDGGMIAWEEAGYPLRNAEP